MNRQRIRSIVCIFLVVCYALGLVCLFLNQTQAGLALWVFSTVGGLVVLFHIKNREAKEQAMKEAAEKQAKDGENKSCE